MKRALKIAMLFSVLALALVPGNVCGQVASPCADIEPPFITTGAKPNILIILDTSGSMAWCFNADNSSNCGNNTRLVTAQAAIIKVLNNLGTKANFGLMTFPDDNDTGAVLQYPISDVNPADPGNQYASMVATINSLSPYNGTPTPGALQAALQYFSGANGSVSPVQYPCQQNFVILVTDGEPDITLGGSGGTYVTKPIVQEAMFGLEELAGLNSSSSKTYTNNAIGSNDSVLSSTFTYDPNPGAWNDSSTSSSNYSWQNVAITFSGNSTATTVKIPTYIMGLSQDITNNPAAQIALGAMATAGGTAVNGQAYICANAGIFIQNLQNIMALIFSNVAAGSSVSTIATTSQAGDNMLQGVFYPAKSFASTGISWPGYLYDWWYTIEQPTSTSMVTGIREDNHGVLPGATTYTTPDYILDLQNDFILDYIFSPTSSQNALSISLYQDTSGNGSSLSQVGTSTGYQMDALTPLWEAGKLLWQTAPANRTIYTPGSTGTSLVAFSSPCSGTSCDSTLTGSSSPLGSATNLDSCLSAPTPTNSSPNPLGNLINYVRGQDLPNTYCYSGTSFQSPLTPCSASNPCASSTYNQCTPDTASCRNRTIGLCTDGGGNYTNTACASTSDCTGTGGSCVSNTWKLGDIVYSTPKVEANYTYCYDNTTSSFTSTACTQASTCSTLSSDSYSCMPKEDLIFVGANDGMLHAFQSGALSTTGLTSTSTDTRVAQLTGIPTSSMGKELWAFIPRNVLPYLRCLASGSNECHLYYNDLTPYITTMTVDNDYCATTDSNNNRTFTTTPCAQDLDCNTGSGQTCVSEGQQTKTILIGGLRLGGGAMGDYCVNSKGGSSGWACGPSGSCPSATTTNTSNYCVNWYGQSNGTACTKSSDCTKNNPYTWYNTCASFSGTCVNSQNNSNGTPCNVNSDCSQGGWGWNNSYNQCSSATVTGGYCVDSNGNTDWQTCTSSSACTTSPYNSACLPFSTCSFISNIPSDTCASPSSYVQSDGTTTGYTPPFSSSNASPCTGLSSYYALDITDPQNPKLLWEFSNPQMGYSYSGPAVIHKWLNPSNMTGNQYDVMFLSGPTNPADGSSALPLRVFVLKLNPITLQIDSVTQKQTDTPIPNGFGGRLFTTGLSVGNDQYTDYVLFGYTSSTVTTGATSNSTTWGGGIGLVYTDATKSSGGATVIDPINGVNPKYWAYDVNTFANVPQAPITSAIAAESCFAKTYLFAGSGKYFYGTDPDIPSSTNALNFMTGMPFTCDNLFTASSCQSKTLSSVNTGNACSTPDATGVANSGALNNGWVYYLPDASTTANWLKERMITDPTPYPNANIIYFTSTQPTSDPCSYGGQSEVWGFNCATGGAITDTSCGAGYTASTAMSDLYLQTSTGAIYNISTTGSSSSANPPLTFNKNGNRSTAYVVGTPPETGLPLSTQPPATGGSGTGQLMLWIER
ncbi:MAG: VWA domain-containing protein [Syntrophobacteraceae bacterium]|nr:VWA domain-containing protein [Syntrophobacteraceae bacterium]